MLDVLVRPRKRQLLQALLKLAAKYDAFKIDLPLAEKPSVNSGLFLADYVPNSLGWVSFSIHCERVVLTLQSHISAAIIMTSHSVEKMKMLGCCTDDVDDNLLDCPHFV